MLKITQSKDELMAARLEIETKTGQKLGHLGIVGRKTLKKFDIEQPVVWASLDWDALVRIASRNNVTFAPLPKTQGVNRDLALLLDAAVPFAAGEECVRRAERKLLSEVTLFDVYEGKNLPAGKKSYAISMTLQDPEKTLNDKAIDATMTRIINALRKDLGAELR